MPLTIAREGERNSIRRVGGTDAARRFLANLGFVENAQVQVISKFNGNLIVNIKDSRVAINEDMARHILV